MEQPVAQRRRFLDRSIRLRWPIYFVGLLIVLGLYLQATHTLEVRRLNGDARAALKEEILSKGVAIAETIAVTARDDIRAENYDKLQEYFSDIVRQPSVDIQYLIVMKLDGEAAVHTNAKYRGKVLNDDSAKKALKAENLTVTEVDSQSLYDVTVPVMGFTSKSAVVCVGISYEKVK